MTYTISNSIPDNHISHRAQQTVCALLKPLEKKHDIHYFNYTVSYPNKTGFTLHTNAEFYKTWFIEEFPMCQFTHDNGWYFWEHCSDKKMIQTANQLGIGKGILHLEHSADKTTTLAFAMRSNSGQSEAFLMNNLNLLKGFGAYFEEEAKKIIQEAEQEMIAYSKAMSNDATELPFTVNSLEQDSGQWPFGPLQLLSKRERQCYLLLIKGHSMLEISELLELSPSSVNMYIARLKQKLNCDSKNDLIEIAQRHGIISCAYSLSSLGITSREFTPLS